jgi:hypothetical protein
VINWLPSPLPTFWAPGLLVSTMELPACGIGTASTARATVWQAELATVTFPSMDGES